MRAAAYARVSSATQRDRDTIASQLRVLPEFCRRMGWTLVETYIDDGHTAKSGRLEARIGLAAMLRDAAAGKFDVVVVVDVDRLTRAEDLTERGAILGALQRAGVKLASATTGQVLDLSTSTGDLFTTLHAFFAAEWGRKHRERIVQGKATALIRGRKPAGPTPFGHLYVRETGVWSIDPVKGPIAREIVLRVGAGESCPAIADDFHARGLPRMRNREWSRANVYFIARSRHVAGEWTADKRKRIVIAVPPIVTEAEWQRAQESLLKHKRRGLRRTKHTYLLEGLAVCGFCRSPMLIRSPTLSRNRNNYVCPPAYVCKRRKLEVHRGDDRCKALIVPTADADARVWEKIVELLGDPAMLDAMFEERARGAGNTHDWQADAAGYRRHLARLEKSVATVLSRARRELITEDAADVELAVIRRERAAVAAHLDFAEQACRSAISAHAELQNRRSALDQLKARAATTSPALQRELVQLLLDPGQAVFDGYNVELALRFDEVVGEIPAPIFLVNGPVCRNVDEAHLRIRLVA